MRAKLKEIRKACESACMNRCLDKGNGLARWSKAGSTTTRRAHQLSRAQCVPLQCRDLWRRSLQRRSQKDVTTWERIEGLARVWLPPPKILHPWPSDRFRVKHPRWGAVCEIP